MQKCDFDQVYVIRKIQKSFISHNLPFSWIILLRCSRHRVFNALFFGGPILCGNTTLVSITVLCMNCKKQHRQHRLRTKQDILNLQYTYFLELSEVQHTKRKREREKVGSKGCGSDSGSSSSRRYITIYTNPLLSHACYMHCPSHLP